MEKKEKKTTFISDLEKKQKRKREDEMGRERKRKKNRKCGANWLLTEGPIAGRVEQMENKKDCLFENNSVCPVTLDKVTVKM